jgi:prepilin peptidase CpaA
MVTPPAWHILAQYVPLLALVALAAVTDLRSRRIPNWLTATVVLAGLAQTLTPWRVTTPLEAFFGVLAGFTITFVLYSIGGRGGGDVKLTAGIGAWLGPETVVIVLLTAAVVSLLSALAQTLITGRLLELLRSAGLMLLVVLHLRRTGAAHGIETLRNWKSIGRPMPNGVSMLVATVLVVMWVAVGH